MTTQKHSAGLSYKKIDLHVHTPASADFADRSVTAEQIVSEAISKGLDAIAVTDHNTADWVDLVATAAAGTTLGVYPGVEITCSGGRGGIHIIAVFELGAGKDTVDYLLSNLGVVPADRGNLNKVIDKSVTDVIKAIRDAGGLAMLAHVNSESGALAEIRGQERIGIVTDPRLNAAETGDTLDAAKAASKTRTIDFLDGSNLDYKNRVLAVYQASDNPDDVPGKRTGHGLWGIGTRVTYFKMDKITLEALRQCFTDPKVRIRLDNPNQPYPQITGISIEGGYFDKKSAELHKGLNSVLGGKGAGKSLLIELMRFGLNQASVVDLVRQDHDSKLRKRLENYGRVTIGIETADGQKQSITRSFKPSENNPYETEAMAAIADKFPVLFLSQNEIISIAEDEKAQLAFIDQFFNFRHHHLIITDLERQLAAWDVRLSDCIRALKEINEVQALIVSATAELADLDKKLQAPIFTELKNQEAKKHFLESRREELNALLKTFDDYSRSDAIDVMDTKLLPEEVQDDPLVKRLHDIENAAKTAAKSQLADTQQTLTDAVAQIDAEEASFLPHYTSAKEKYDEHVRQSGGDGKILAEKRAQKFKELQSLRARHQKLKTSSSQIKETARQRKEVLDTLKGAYDTYAKERQTKVKSIEKSANGRLSLDIDIAENRDEFTRRLTELKRGSYLKDFEITKISENIDPYTLINTVLYYVISDDAKYIEQIAEQVQLDVERVRVLVDFLVNNFEHEELLALQYKAMPEDRPKIAYNVSDDPEQPNFRPIAELSTGQKCTAMLIIALSEGDQPIIIDQPEDSLDIKSVWHDMCKRLRSGKENRQFVFTTHNSSLAVASDTDRFLILEGGASTGDFVLSGSMDDPSINEQVVKYLEGDLEAYRLKSEKYNINRK